VHYITILLKFCHNYAFFSLIYVIVYTGFFLNFYKKLLYWLLFHHPEEQSLRKSIDMCIFVAIDAALT